MKKYLLTTALALALLVITPLVPIGFVLGLAWFGFQAGVGGAERFLDWSRSQNGRE